MVQISILFLYKSRLNEYNYLDSRINMLPIRTIKNNITGILVSFADLTMFTLLLLAIPLFIIASGLQTIVDTIIRIPVELVIPIALVSLFGLMGSYKSSSSTNEVLSIKRPLLIIWGLSLFIITLLINQPPSTINSTSYLLKIVVIAAIYSSFILINRIVIQLLVSFLLRKNIITHRVLFSFHHSVESPYLKEFLRRIKTNHQTLIGYSSNKKSDHSYLQDTAHLGEYIKTDEICSQFNIDEVVIFNPSQSIRDTEQILTQIDTKKTLVRITPEGKEYLINQQASRQPDEIPTISIQPKETSIGYKLLRRLLDISVAIVGLIFTSLLFPYISYKIKKGSEGPVLYKQLRQSKKGRSFILYKFRTMYVDAEKNGPLLTTKDNDPRITDIGHILRRVHLDELPQFWNVLKGDMSIVGIRPEREYYIKKLEKETPYYKFVRQVKPGLTSLAMVKYGYAHNLKEMKERMLYDIIYLNNRSFLFDLQIIGYTVTYIFNKMLFKAK